MTDSNHASDDAQQLPGKLDLDLLRSTADLARLDLTQDELTRFAPEFAAILGAFEVLSELDVEGVPPTLGATDLQDVKRPDVARPATLSEALLAGAPDRREDSFGVPKTIGGSTEGGAQ